MQTDGVVIGAGAAGLMCAFTAAARGRGFRLLFEDRHPHAGGADHYAAYLEAPDGFEVELVADPADPA